jgi:hypothetical protein
MERMASNVFGDDSAIGNAFKKEMQGDRLADRKRQKRKTAVLSLVISVAQARTPTMFSMPQRLRASAEEGNDSCSG